MLPTPTPTLLRAVMPSRLRPVVRASLALVVAMAIGVMPAVVVHVVDNLVDNLRCAQTTIDCDRLCGSRNVAACALELAVAALHDQRRGTP